MPEKSKICDPEYSVLLPEETVCEILEAKALAWAYDQVASDLFRKYTVPAIDCGFLPEFFERRLYYHFQDTKRSRQLTDVYLPDCFQNAKYRFGLNLMNRRYSIWDSDKVAAHIIKQLDASNVTDLQMQDLQRTNFECYFAIDNLSFLLATCQEEVCRPLIEEAFRQLEESACEFHLCTYAIWMVEERFPFPFYEYTIDIKNKVIHVRYKDQKEDACEALSKTGRL